MTENPAPPGEYNCIPRSIDALSDRYAQLKISALNIIRNLCHLEGSPIDDNHIHDHLQLSLSPIEIGGVVVHFGKTGLWQSCFSFELTSNNEHCREVLEFLKNVSFLQKKGSRIDKFNAAGNEYTYIQRTIENTDTHRNNCDLDDVFLLTPSTALFGNLKEIRAQSVSEYEHCWFAIFTTLREVFLHRNHAYRHFPLELSQRYWDQVSLPPNPPPPMGSFHPPWAEQKNGEKRVETITLSLDLRKSTIAMEQATDLGRFADWMRDLIKALTEIALDHLAVFDKFTGDGIIVHFLEEDVKRLLAPNRPPQTTIEQAVACAAAMIDEVNRRLEGLREYLQSDFSNLGAAVGLAVGKAQWSVDHAGNPIVVGRGVAWWVPVAPSARHLRGLFV